MGRLLVSSTVVTIFWLTPCVIVPFVAPFAKAMLIDAGGQVEKYPAVDPVPETEARISVVPGICAVIWLVVALIEATELVATLKVRVPIELLQEETPSVLGVGSQSKVRWPLLL